MDQEDQTAGRMQSSIMETPPSESQTPGRVTSALGASTQQDAHPLPEQINHMDLDRTADSSIAPRFGTMLINTIPEERTLGASSIQGASGTLIDANTGEDGSAQFFQEQDDFLAKYELELELDAQHRLKLSDIHATSPGSGMFTTANTGEPSMQYPESSVYTAAGTAGAGGQIQHSMQMQMQSNMTMLMGLLAKQQTEFQKQMLDMEARQKRELTNILQSQQTAQSSSNRVGHPLSPNSNYSATYPTPPGDQLVSSLVTALGQVSSNKSGLKELSKVKDTDDVAKILSKWSMELRSMDVHERQWVKKVLPCMIEGGNLHKWSLAYQPSMDLNGLIYDVDDPKYIYNWTWDQLVKSLSTTGMWKRPDLQKNINAIHSAKCEEDADGPKIQQYIDKFKIDYQLVSAQRLYHIVPPEAAAYCLFNGLPPYFKEHMNRRTAPGPYQNIRTDMDALLLEINMTMQDSSCAGEMASKGRRAMGAATEIKQPHPHGVDRKGPQHIGKVGDHIGVTSSTDSIDNIFAAMRNIRQAEGPRFQYRVTQKRDHTLVVISHPDQNMVTNFHARPDLKCSLTPARVMPFKATTARAPGAHGKGAASVNSSQGAASGANFQPTLQAPPPGGVQSPASFAAPQLTSSSTVSTILPSDSASVIHADLQGNSALTGSVTRTGPATYYQNMTNTSGRSDSGFHPPSANMATVRRPVAFTANIVSTQGPASDFDNRLLKAAWRALGLDEYDSDSDEEHHDINEDKAHSPEKVEEMEIADPPEEFLESMELADSPEEVEEMELAEVLQIAEDLVDAVMSLNLCGTQAIDGWVTVGSACLYNRQAPGGDPLAKEFNNYYAVLGTIDIAAEFQKVNHEAVSTPLDQRSVHKDNSRAVDQRSDHKDNSRARAMKHRKKRKRKRQRKPTMRGVQFTNSPPIVPRHHIAPEFPSNEKYLNIKKYINVYRECGKAQAHAYLARHQRMSSNLGTEIDARELDPYESTCNGIIQQVNMNGNYEVDFGQGRMKYISECTLQEILLARRVVQDREKWQLDIQRKMDKLLPEDWITDNVHIEAMATEGGQFINAATQVVPPVMTARHTQTQWIRSMLVLCVGLGFLYSPMPMEISLIDLAFLPLVVLITGYVARNARCSGTTTRRALGISIWANLPFSRSIPILPIIDAHRVCLSPAPHLSDLVYTRDLYSQSIIYASIIILVHCIWKIFLRRNSATPIIACPALVSADSQRAMQACAAMNIFGKFPGKRMGMLDSGCNELIIKLDDESRAFASNWNRDDVTVGDAAAGTFTTDGTATMYVGMDFKDIKGNQCELVAQTRVTLCAQFNWDLFPTRWFQNAGHTIIFEGKECIEARDDSGNVTVQINQLLPHGTLQSAPHRQMLGNLTLETWNHLSFFPYSFHSPPTSIHAHSMDIQSRGYSKEMLSAKYHTIFGCCDQRRVYKACARAGICVLTSLPSPCPLCAATKSSTPSRRMYERTNVSPREVTGQYFQPVEPELKHAIKQLAESDAAAAKYETIIESSVPVQATSCICHGVHNIQCFPARSTKPGQFFHADTIPLGRCWNGICEALVLVDDCHRKIYTYAMKNRSGASVADKLRGHCLKLRHTPEGMHYYSHRIQLQSDQGSEFINRDVLNWSKEVGAIQSFSCPGDLGKWQNSTCERKIKDLGAIMRSIMHRSNAPTAAAEYAMYHAVDIMNALPTSANITLDASAGLSPNEVEGMPDTDLTSFHAFGSQCFVHLDSEHRISSEPNVQAAACIYLCRAHHLGAPGHVVWDYIHRRRLIVPSIKHPQWNYYPLRSPGPCHLSSRLTWESPPVESIPTVEQQPIDHSLPHTSPEDSSEDNHSIPIIQIDDNDAAELPISNSPHITRLRLKMERHIGAPVRKVFFINGVGGDVDYYEGKVHSITANNKYLIIYTDGDSEEMNHRDFIKYNKSVVCQVADLNKSAQDKNIQWVKPSCNCVSASCVHPWGNTSLRSKDSGGTGKIRVQDNKSLTYVPSDIPPHPDAIDYYAAMTFGHLMPEVEILWGPSKISMEDKIQSNSASSYAIRSKEGKKSAYDPDPKSIDQCKSSVNWERPVQGNSWWESIKSEVENFIRYGVFTIVDAKAAGANQIFPSVITFVTKRTKDSTPENEIVDKRKTRICFGGHRCILGRDYTKIDAYAPVPTWGTIKLQLALTALHKMKLKAFDCTAAYLQTEIDKEMYVRPPPGLMSLLGRNQSDVWKLNKAMYGYPRGANLWYQKLFKYLKEYGFRPLGSSATFMMLDRGPEGRILMNVYSDDGLASTNNEMLWDKFMSDFKSKFDVKEKSPDYFLGAGIIQHESGAISLDPSK